MDGIMSKADCTTELGEENHEPERKSSATDKLLHKLRKKKGDLKGTLDGTLEARLPPGKSGRPEGARNYEWTPETDRILEDLCDRLGPSTAKRIMQKKLLDGRGCDPGEFKPRPDSVRTAVERRMQRLGLPTGQGRKDGVAKTAKPWTPTNVTALLGAIGGDLTDESIEQRTEHSINAVRAKLVRLSYKAVELRSVAFTVDELAATLEVTSRQVRRWKEKGWLKTTRRRVTDKDLAAFVKEHAERIPYNQLPRHVQVFLLEIGYPASDARAFQAAVKSILDDVAGRKKRCDARRDHLDSKPARAKPPAVRWLPLAFGHSGLARARSA
jgi:hypothetical protein